MKIISNVLTVVWGLILAGILVVLYGLLAPIFIVYVVVLAVGAALCMGLFGIALAVYDHLERLVKP